MTSSLHFSSYLLTSNHHSCLAPLPPLVSPTPLPSRALDYTKVPSKVPPAKMADLSPSPRALLFDVFGTCVDWHTTVMNTLDTACHAALNSASSSIATTVRVQASAMTVGEWGVFAHAWRNSYKAFTRALAADPTLPWKTVDEHHHDSLVDLLGRYQLTGLWNPVELRQVSLVWHHLEPWEDSRDGIHVLNQRFWTVTLSNGNLSLLADLKTYAGLAFTHVFSAEMFGTYKPAERVYRGAVDRLGISPGEALMVASHLADLKAAKACGLRTAYIERAEEEDWDEARVEQARQEGFVDVWITPQEKGFLALAAQLGCSIPNGERRRSRSQ